MKPSGGASRGEDGRTPAADASEEYWDHHHHIAEDPFFWMAHPLCRSAINRRVTGDPNLWPLHGFARKFGATLSRGISLGCGIGNLERAARSVGLCDEITGLDFSKASIDVARHRAEEEGVSGLTYTAADLNELSLPASSVDVVFIHQSLHHVVTVEKLLATVARAIRPDGLLYLDEWVGPSNDEWTEAKLARATALYDEVPPSWRRAPRLPKPIAAEDPSEGIRSSAILPSLRLLFDFVEERPYGGHLVSVLTSQMHASAGEDPRFPGFLAKWLELEEEDLRTHPRRSFYTVIVARPRRGVRGAVARVRGLARRARLAIGIAERRGRMHTH